MSPSDIAHRRRQAGLDTKLCFAEYAGKLRPYRLFYPSSYEFAPKVPKGEAKTFPLVLMLHGGGSLDYPCDENWYFANKETPERVQDIAEERGYIVACPALPHTLVPGNAPDRRERMMREIEQETVPFLAAMVKDITYGHHIDKERVCITGASRGGYATYAALNSNPEAYAAAAPVCTMCPEEWLENAAKVPTLILHTVDDAIFPIEKAREQKRKLEELGCDVKMAEFPGGHEGLRNTKAYKVIFDWFDAHRRQGKEAAKGS